MLRLDLSPREVERRVERLEKEHRAANADPANLERLDDLRFQIGGLLGKPYLHLLREYTDRLIAEFNADCDWFYKKGLTEPRGRHSGQGEEPKK